MFNKIQTVQRSFTKSIGNLRSSTYNEHLVNLKLDSLQCRRLKTDLITCYKIMNVVADVNSSCFFSAYSTLGNSFKLAKLAVVSECDINFLLIQLSKFGILWLIIL